MLMIYMNIGVAFTTAAFFLLNPDDTVWMFALYITSAFIGGPSPVLLWSMYADTADYSEVANTASCDWISFFGSNILPENGMCRWSRNDRLLLGVFSVRGTCQWC